MNAFNIVKRRESTYCVIVFIHLLFSILFSHQLSFHCFESLAVLHAIFSLLSFFLGAREIVRRVSARARTRSRPTTPKPSQVTNNDKMARRSSSRYSRGSHKRDRGDVSSELADSGSKTSVRTSVRGSRNASAKSYVVELDERYTLKIRRPHCSLFSTILFSIGVEQCYSKLLTTMNNVSNTTLRFHAGHTYN